MALAFTSLTSGEDGDGGSSSPTANFTPAANSLVLVAVSTGLSGAAAAPSSLTGHSLTWTARGNATISNGNLNVALFSAQVGGSPGSDNIDINYSGITPTNSIWEVVQVTGHDATTPIAQTKQRGGAGFSFSAPSLTFDSAVDVTSAIFGAFAKNNQTAVGTSGGGYTKIGSGLDDGSPSNQIFAQYDATAGVSHDGVFDMAWDSASGVAIAAVEINEAPQDPGGGSPTIAATLLDDGSSTADQTSYGTVDSISPGANRLILAFIASGDTGGASTVPTVSGAGLTFTHVVGNQQGSGNQRVDIFRAMSATPSSGALTIGYGAVQQENVAWTIVQVDGVDTSGANGSGAIVQTANVDDSNANVSVALSSAVGAGNATFGIATGNTTSPNWSAGSGFVQLGSTWSLTTPSNKGMVEWDVDGQQTVAFSNDGSPLVALAAIEVKVGAAEPINAQAILGGLGDLDAGYVFTHQPIVFGGADGSGTLVAVAEDPVPVVSANLSGTGSLTASATPPSDVESVAIGTGTLTAIGTVTPGVPVGIMYGWHQEGNDKDEIKQIEAALNKNFAILRMFDGQGFIYPSAKVFELSADHGGRLMIWSAKTFNWDKVADPNSGFVTPAGESINEWIDNLGAMLDEEIEHEQVIFIFHHEPHGEVKNDTEEPEQFSRAVKRIHDRWAANNLLYKQGQGGKILIGYCDVRSNITPVGRDAIWYADPEATAIMDECIDILCHDGYNQIIEKPSTAKANRLFGHDSNENENWHQVLEVCEFQQKPLIIAEWGCWSVNALPGAAADDTCWANGFHDDLKARLAATGGEQLAGGPYSPDRDGWFDQAAYFMKNDPLAKKWLKGFCYYHARRWMFVEPNGDPHHSGCSDDPVDRGGVEGIDAWTDFFVEDSYFNPAPFEPLSSSPINPPPTDPPTNPPPGGVSSCVATEWNAVTPVVDGIPSVLSQISGMAASPTLPGLWAVTDNPVRSLFYMTQTTPGTFTAEEVAVNGAGSDNPDWEDLAVTIEDGDNYIYIHSNRGNNETVKPKRLIKVQEPADPANTANVNPVTIRYWQFPAGLLGATCASYFNCEGIEVYNGRLYAVRKRKNEDAEVFDFGPTNALSPDENNPSMPVEQLGVIDHGCPSSLALSTNGKSLLTVSHGKARVWRAKSGSGMKACLKGNNDLVGEFNLPAVGGDPTNTESGDFWPYNTCSLIVASESRNTYIYEDASPPPAELEDVSLPIAPNFDSATKSVYTTASFTPDADTNYTVFVLNGKIAGGGDKPSSVAGAGLTWSEKFDATVQANQKVTLYQGIGASPTTDEITITFSANQDACLWFVVKTPGRELVADIEQAGGTGTLNPTTGAISALEPDCIPWVFCSINSTSGTVEPGAGFTKLGDSVSATSPSLQASLGYTLDDNQTPGTAVLDSTGRTYKILASAWVPV